jgi:hypothetical protein
MLLFEKLESLGYEKKSNWYIQKNISINLFTKEVKSSNRNVLFNYVFDKEVDVDKCELIRLFISSFETQSQQSHITFRRLPMLAFWNTNLST